MNGIIEVENLRHRYTQKEALQGITFRLQRGEIAGLLGPNGAGKTTTVNILAGILAQSDGAVRVHGFSIPDEQMSAKRIIGYVPETAIVYESLTAKEFLELMGRLRGIEEKILQHKILELLEVFGIAEVRFQRLVSFSKGMRQKVLLIAALLHDPAILLLDEPLSGLDVMSAALVKDLLAALASEGKTILYSSHVLDVVEKICSRVLILHEGKLIADDAPGALKAGNRGDTLEQVFRQLTQAADTAPSVKRACATIRL